MMLNRAHLDHYRIAYNDLNGPDFFLFNATRVSDWYPKIGLNRAGHGYQSGI